MAFPIILLLTAVSCYWGILSAAKAEGHIS